MICSRAEILAFLGKSTSLTDTEDILLSMLGPLAEQSVKDHLGYSVEQTTYTHFLPKDERGTSVDPLNVSFDTSGDRVLMTQIRGTREYADLFLPELPVRSVDSVYSDASAYGGQASGDFASTTLLTAGTDFYIDYTTSGLCKSGRLVRIAGYWPSRARTVKVTYTGGYTQAELSTGIATPIKMACLLTIQQAFSSKGTGEGQIKSERLGDYSVEYISEKASKIPIKALRLLQPFVSYQRFM